MSEVDARCRGGAAAGGGARRPSCSTTCGVLDERTLACELRGHRPYLLHYWGGPKPWARNAWIRVSRDAYVRLMPRLLLAPDVPVRLEPGELPLWLRRTPAGRSALMLLSGVNRSARAVLAHVPAAARRRLSRGIRRPGALSRLRLEPRVAPTLERQGLDSRAGRISRLARGAGRRLPHACMPAPRWPRITPTRTFTRTRSSVGSRSPRRPRGRRTAACSSPRSPASSRCSIRDESSAADDPRHLGRGERRLRPRPARSRDRHRASRRTTTCTCSTRARSIR